MAVGGWDVFVSYGHEDAAWVRVLAGNLHRAGFDVFLDEWEPRSTSPDAAYSSKIAPISAPCPAWSM